MIADDFPELNEPTMICAFAGWNDAGDAATGALEHLELSWDARHLGSMDPEEYYDFQVNRPTVSLVDGVSRRLRWPTTHVSTARPPGASRDVVFVRGIEPNYRWASYCEELLDVARDLMVEQIVLLGALQADLHFEQPSPVTGSAWDEQSAERYKLSLSRYEGPTGIVGVLHEAAVRAGFPAVSFWASVPYYVNVQGWSPAILALLQRIELVLDVPIQTGLLQDQAQQSVRIVRDLVSGDPELAAHLADLPAEEVTDATADELAEEFERYLRRQSGEDPNAG